MLTAVLVTQMVFNLLVLYGMWRLVQQRALACHAAEQREARLEALAKEFCAVGAELSRDAHHLPAPCQPMPPVAPCPPDRPAGSLGAATLVPHGLSGERVADVAALPDGEAEVLANLRRTRPATKPIQAHRPKAAGSAPGPAKPRKAVAARRAARAAAR